MHVATARYKGEERTKRHLRPTASAPQSVAALAATLPTWQWYRRTVSEGTKRPIAYNFARHRVTLWKDGLPERTVWLVIKRTCGSEPTYAYALSNAPVSILFRTLVWLSGIRWAVEQCFEEGKTELGMAHYTDAHGGCHCSPHAARACHCYSARAMLLRRTFGCVWT